MTSIPSYLNLRDTIIQPGDPLELDLTLVNSRGQAFNLNNRFARVRFISRGTGMSFSALASDIVPGSVQITILNPTQGLIRLSSKGDVLNEPRGYRYVVETRLNSEPVEAFKAIARGQIQVFNQSGHF